MKSKDYYTASEAQKILGLDKAMFHRRVGEGLIPSITRPGYKQKVYPARDIDALALSMNWFFDTHDKYVFSKSSPGDQVEEMDIGIRCFGHQYITPLPERIAFQQKNNFTFWSLKVLGHVVGYISMFHFPPDFLDDILTGRRIEREITLNEVLPFERLQPFNIYIDVLAMDPNIAPYLKTYYASVLISRFADEVLNLIGTGYEIETFYTVTATQEGDHLVNQAGFRLMEGKSIVPGRIAYHFPMDEAGIQMLTNRSRRRMYHDHSHTKTEGHAR